MKAEGRRMKEERIAALEIERGINQLLDLIGSWAREFGSPADPELAEIVNALGNRDLNFLEELAVAWKIRSPQWFANATETSILVRMQAFVRLCSGPIRQQTC